VPGHLVVDETESELVRMLYGWLIEGWMSVRQILKRLNKGPWSPRPGSALHPLRSRLRQPLRYVPLEKPRARGPRTGENTSRKLSPKEK
jgi:site-specific DNA recombinase